MHDERIARRGTVVDEAGSPIPVGPPFRLAAAGDVNGDGKSDLVWYNESTGETQIWFMHHERIARRGTVVDETGSPIFVGPPFRLAAAGDTNGDGKSDLIWHNGDTGETQIWFMHEARIARRGTVVDEAGSPIPVGLPWRLAAAGNSNGDGKSDLIWHNGDSGETQIWFMDDQRIARRGTVVDGAGNPVFVGPPFRLAAAGQTTLPGAQPGTNGVLPETVTLHSGPITSGLSIGGSATLVMASNGDFTFSGHMHNSGALGIDYLLTLVAMTPSGIAYTVQRQGNTAGTLTTGSHDDDWTTADRKDGIRERWAEASQASLTWTMHANDTLTNQVAKALEEALHDAIKAAGQAAVKAVIALI